MFVTADGDDVFADEILVAAGRQPNVAGLDLDVAGITHDKTCGIHVNDRLQTARSHIFAAGDVASGFRFTHNADVQARIVLRNALFAGRESTTQFSIPRCTYTSPEVAQLGMTTSQAIALDVPHDSYRVDWAELDRGRTDPAGEGFAQVLTRRGSDQILGATVVGHDAGEQLATLSVLQANGLGLKALNKAVLPYPTRSEYLKRLADAYNRTRLTPRLAKLFRWWLSITR